MELREITALVKQAKNIIDDRELASQVRTKGRADYVTQVDIAVQNFLKEELARLAPEVEFMGEETGVREMNAESFWILDPVDGTTNLMYDFRHSVVSLALWKGGEIVMGIVYDPYRDETFTAEKGKGSFLNGSPIHVSEAASLSDTVIGIGTSPYYRELTEANFARFRRVFDRSRDIRRLGSAATDLAYVACGRQDGFFEAYLSPWDFAAGLLLVREAGGTVTDFCGNSPDPRHGGSVAGTNGRIHSELLSLL